MTIRSAASFSDSARDKPAVAAAVAGESGLDDQAGRLSYEAEAAALSGGISAAGIELASSGNGSAEVSLPQRPRRRQEAGHALPREIADDQPRNDRQMTGQRAGHTLRDCLAVCWRLSSCARSWK